MESVNMKTLSVSKAKELLSKLVSEQETLYLLSTPGMRESIREGLQTPISECSEELGW